MPKTSCLKSIYDRTTHDVFIVNKKQKYMKKIFVLLITLISVISAAQDSSTISIIPSKSRKNTVYKIVFNDREIADIVSGENLEYKIFSQGRVVINVFFLGLRAQTYIDIKLGNTYYLELDELFAQIKSIDQEKANTLFLKKEYLIVSKSEDKNNPIVKSSDEPGAGSQQGTCFIIGRNGYLITNYHVIRGAKEAKIRGINNDFTVVHSADVVAFDIVLDLALLKIKDPSIIFDSLPYPISKTISHQGTKSFVLGYPLSDIMGEEIKLTDGIVSAKSGFKGSISHYQFSAAVQPGNSGSPLFNENGILIGVINAKLIGAEGAGYAIKSQYLSAFLSLIENRQIDTSSSAVRYSSLADLSNKFKDFIFIVETE